MWKIGQKLVYTGSGEWFAGGYFESYGPKRDQIVIFDGYTYGTEFIFLVGYDQIAANGLRSSYYAKNFIPVIEKTIYKTVTVEVDEKVRELQKAELTEN